MQLCVNQLAQHKLALTSGRFVSLIFFLAPHGMYRWHQVKHPALIVRNQRTEQGVSTKARLAMTNDIWGNLREASLHCTWHAFAGINHRIQVPTMENDVIAVAYSQTPLTQWHHASWFSIVDNIRSQNLLWRISSPSWRWDTYTTSLTILLSDFNLKVRDVGFPRGYYSHL